MLSARARCFLPVLAGAAVVLAGCRGGDAAGDTPTTTAVDPPAAPAPPEKESAFDSNQWNSAVGLGGGAAGAYGGRAEPSAESYAEVPAAGFLAPDAAPLSTFGADVDTASFANARRFLSEGRLPPAASVRLEEFVNAQRYADPEPAGSAPLLLHAELAPCPWQPSHRLARLSVRTRSIDTARVPPCNLVFLIDVSGSMQSQDKLPLLVRAMGLLVDQLRPQDRVSIVTYAGRAAVALEAASGAERARIHEVLQGLQAAGSTGGEGGIRKAYELAGKHRVTGVNRVLLATDGDFNVGVSSVEELHALIEEHKRGRVFLTVLGFGSGNLKDDRLEVLADKGNGVYAYVDGLAEARRVLVEQFGASMMTVASDVKLQVEFAPRHVARYRLLGYENRALAARDFRDDTKDGGELGAGHAVTALYQIEPQQGAPATGELLRLRVRYKPPEGDRSRELERSLPAEEATGQPSDDFRLAASAAALAMALRGDDIGWQVVRELAAALPAERAGALRAMVERAHGIAAGSEAAARR